MPLPSEEQTPPVFQLLLVQVETGVGRKMGRPDQIPFQVIGPAVDRTHHIALEDALPLQHDGLPVTADVGHEPVTIILV